MTTTRVSAQPGPAADEVLVRLDLEDGTPCNVLLTGARSVREKYEHLDAEMENANETHEKRLAELHAERSAIFDSIRQRRAGVDAEAFGLAEAVLEEEQKAREQAERDRQNAAAVDAASTQHGGG